MNVIRVIAFLLLGFVTTACGVGFVTDRGARLGCGNPELIHVEPVYPTSGADWLSYVRNDGVTPFSATGTPCDGTEGGNYFEACLHGGELRRAPLPGVNDCDGLSGSDTLGAFDWTCDDSGEEVVYRSSGLAGGMSLRDLVEASAWAEVRLEVERDGCVAYTSGPEDAWWGNPIMPLPDNSATAVESLSDAGTVYTLSESRTSMGYNIDADRVAVVTLDDSVLSYAGGASANCSTSTGETTTPNAICLLASGSQSFIWVEAELNSASTGTDADYGLLAHTVVHFALRETTLASAVADNLQVAGSEKGYFVGLTSIDAGADGVSLLGGAAANHFFHYVDVMGAGSDGISVTSDGNHFYYLTTADNSVDGIRIETGSDSNVLAGVRTYNNGGRGLFLGASATAITAVDVLTSANGQRGVEVSDPNGATLSHVGAFNEPEAVSVAGGTDVYVSGLLVANTGSEALRIISPASIYFYDTYIYRLSGGPIIYTGTPTSVQYHGELQISSSGASGDCSGADGTAVTGLTDACQAGTGSSSTLTPSVDLSASFSGKADSDSVNGHPSGQESYTAITDWLNFESDYRVWGLDGSPFPAIDHQTQCSGASTCRIWDWRLDASDAAIRSAFGSFAPGVACPAAAAGSEAVSDSIGNTFLARAREILFDGIGDEDGLCESGESCVFAPNPGAYQGHGGISQEPCLFSDGTVMSVTLHGYAVNGI